MNTKFDLDERLIRFAANMIQIAAALPSTFAGNHLPNQLVRSGTSPALNYGEAQGAESRETYCCLRIIQKQNWLEDEKPIEVMFLVRYSIDSPD